MAEMSNYLENALVNATLRNTSYTSPAAPFLALYTSDPTDADSGTECSGTSYARQSITFGAPSNGVTTNSAAIEFPQAGGACERLRTSVFVMRLLLETCCFTRLWMRLRPLQRGTFSEWPLVR